MWGCANRQSAATPPLPQVTIEAHAPGNLKGRDDATLDLLAALSSAFADGAKFPARPIEVSREPVALAGSELGQQLLDGLSHVRQFLNECLAVHTS